MSAGVVGWVLRESEERLGRRLVLLVLADHANGDGSNVWTGVGTIAREARMSERQTRACLRELEASGAIAKTGVSPSGTNIYCVIMRGANFAAPEESGREGGEIRSVAQSDFAPEPSLEQPKGSQGHNTLSRNDRNEVIECWQTQEPLPRHRPEFLATLHQQIDKAVERYTADVVKQAIVSYATVLGSPEHYWSHRWTLGEFLQRGLTKFLPEMNPLDNYRLTDGVKGKSGRSAKDIYALAEHLEDP